MNGAQATTARRRRLRAALDTHQIFTFVILLGYIVLLAGFIGLSGFEAHEKWFELVKLGFTTMGSALTLVLGYYFGQREVAAFKDKEAVREKLEEAKTLVAEKQENVATLVERMQRQSTTSEPDTLPNAANRPKGRPKKDDE